MLANLCSRPALCSYNGLLNEVIMVGDVKAMMDPLAWGLSIWAYLAAAEWLTCQQVWCWTPVMVVSLEVNDQALGG